MTLPFCEEIINGGEITPYDFTHPNFVGYLNPNGEPIDYSKPFGLGGHDNNSTTDLFKEFFRVKYYNYISPNPENYFITSFKYEDKAREKRMCDRQLNKIDDRLENITSDIKYDFKYGRNPSKFLLMKYDLLLFFRNCYSSGNFDQGFGQKVRFMNMSEFYDKVFQYIEQKSFKLYKIHKTIPRYYTFDFQYDLYKTREFLDLLKQVFICYMGYHSVERIPRTITTSEPKIYETFWNYLVHNFNIVYLPRMIFDPNKKTHIECPINEFFIPDSELRLKSELQSIKKLVPLDERYKYHM